MNHILLITSRPRGSEGLSTRCAGKLATQLAAQRPGTTLTVRDLAAAPLNHIGEAYAVGRATPPDERTAAQAEAVQLAENLVAELAAADTVVIGSAMINFGPPSSLKAWFDHVTWPGVTFRYSGNSVEGTAYGPEATQVAVASADKALQSLLKQADSLLTPHPDCVEATQ